MNVGFSTGSLAKGDFSRAIEMLAQTTANVIELSALRESEVVLLVDSLDYLNLSQFSYISFHAPSKITSFSEDYLVSYLHKVKEKGINIILHPDVIVDYDIWRSLGSSLCIENMDKRKPIGRTTRDLERVFKQLPEATFCLDLAHAKQIDPTMTEAFMMINCFSDRLAQIHLSDVNSNNAHEPLNLEAIFSYHKVASFIDSKIPIVLESPVSINCMQMELYAAAIIFDNEKFNKLMKKFNITLHSHSGHLHDL